MAIYFYIWFIFLLISYFIILFGYMHFSHKKDIINNIFGFGALFFVFIHILIFLLFTFQEEELHDELLPNFTLTLVIPLIIISITILISTGVVYYYRYVNKSKDYSELEIKLDKRSKKISKLRRDTYRKISHILIFITLFIVWFLSYDYVKKTSEENAKPKIEPKTTNMFHLYLRLLTEPNSFEKVLFCLEWFYYVLFFFFYIFCLVMLANEFTRKTKYFAFPLNILPKLLMNEEEKQKFGTYLYFAIGQMFAAFICPPMAFFAILGISSIGDLTSSQIGLKYGKRHILWNKNKTWEGAVAGFITCIVLCFFFVGFIYALIFAISFMCIDLFTHKPLNISDNLLIPIGCALIFIFIRFGFDLNYNATVLQFL